MEQAREGTAKRPGHAGRPGALLVRRRSAREVGAGSSPARGFRGRRCPAGTGAEGRWPDCAAWPSPAGHCRCGCGSGVLLLHLDHAQVALRQVVVEGHLEVVHEGEHGGAVLFQPVEQVLGRRLPGSAALTGDTGNSRETLNGSGASASVGSRCRQRQENPGADRQRPPNALYSVRMAPDQRHHGRQPGHL